MNKVGGDYLGLLVLGFINTSIAAEQMRGRFSARHQVRRGGIGCAR